MGELLVPCRGDGLGGRRGLKVTGFRDGRGRYVSNRDVYLSVTLAWTLAALLGGTPFLISFNASP